MQAASLRQRALGREAPVDRGLQRRGQLGASPTSLCRAGARLLHLRASQAHLVADELKSRLLDLTLQALVQLGRFGLALERSQSRARLALDVERSVEVLLRALELQLRPPPALAVLAQARRLLDQQPPVAGPGGHDRLDAALRDDRVRLLAQTRVGERLDHVAEAATSAVEPVLALAGAIEASHDRDLAERQLDGAVGVVEHDLHLGRAARLHAVSTAEDHILHRLAAHRKRRLLAHRPQHGVGDVRLARAVRAYDHAHAGTEVESRAIGEGLEALQRERLQVHAAAIPPAARRLRARPAARRASCCGRFLCRAPCHRRTRRPCSGEHAEGPPRAPPRS